MRTRSAGPACQTTCLTASTPPDRDLCLHVPVGQPTSPARQGLTGNFQNPDFEMGSCQTDSRNPPGQYGLILLVWRNTTFPSGRTTQVARSPALPVVTYPNAPLTGVPSASRPSTTKWSSRLIVNVAVAAPPVGT